MQTLSTIEILILIAVLSAGVSAATTFVVSYLIEWSVWRKGSKVHKMELSFDENEKNERFLKLRWGVIYVRDGRDDVVPKLSEREKWFARLRNKIIYFRGYNPKKAKIQFYRTLGCQFKCFVELDNLELFDDLKNFLVGNGYKAVSRGKRYGRVWFIHKDTDKYATVETSEGIVNNFLYPE